MRRPGATAAHFGTAAPARVAARTTDYAVADIAPAASLARSGVGHDFRRLSRREDTASETSETAETEVAREPESMPTPAIAGDTGAIEMKAGANTGSTSLPATVTTTYDVGGDTLADVAANLPADEAGNAGFVITITGTTGDPITSATANVTHTVELPHWTERDKQCEPVKRAWDRFLSALTSHENGHISLSRTRLAAVHTKFIGIALSDIGTKTASETAATQSAYDAYDAANGHGLTGTPPTILDTTIVCPPPAQPKTSALDTGPTDEVAAKRDIKGQHAARSPSADVEGGADVSSVVSEGLSGGGQPLDSSTRAFMEPRLGQDLSNIRVHTGSAASQSAESVSARAYAVGNHIAFKDGEYNPGTSAGRHLLAHELTHTVQQGATTPLSRKPEGKSCAACAAHSARPPTAGDSVPRKCAECEAKEKEMDWSVDRAMLARSPGLTLSRKENPPAVSGAGADAAPVSAIPAAASSGAGETGAVATATPAPASVEGTTGGGSRAGPAGAASTAGSAGATGATSTSSPGPSTDVSATAGSPGEPALRSGGVAGLAGGGITALLSVMPSNMLLAIGQAKSTAAEQHQNDRSETTEGMPSLPQPTGMTPGPSPTAPPLPAIKGQAPDFAAAAPIPTPQPTPTPEGTGPLPGSQVSTTATPPAENKEDGGGWWSWLTNRIRSFTGSLPTRDPGLSTSAGVAPPLELSGDADPSQMGQHKEVSQTEAIGKKAEADAATQANFGETGILPAVRPSVMKPNRPLAPPPLPTAPAPISLPESLTAEEREQFNQANAPEQHQKTAEQAELYKAQQDEQKVAVEKAKSDGQQRIADENRQTAQQQESIRQQVSGEVHGEKQRWQAENQKLLTDYQGKVDSRSSEVQNEIQSKTASTDKSVTQTLKEGEQQAEAERVKTETAAAAKKKEVESRPKSFWDKVKDGISSVFDEIKQSLNTMFDTLRKAVKTIIETTKKAVHALIDAARTAIVGLIKTFGAFVKGLVSVLLAAFPEIAAKARAWIDERIRSAEDRINRAADTLKAATDAILDGVAAAIDLALSLVQKAYNAALDVLEQVALAPIKAIQAAADLLMKVKQFKEAFDAIQKFCENPGQVMAELNVKIGAMMAQVPEKASAAAMEAFASFKDVDARNDMGSAVASDPAPATAAVQRAPDPDASRQERLRALGKKEYMSVVGQYLAEAGQFLLSNWLTVIGGMLLDIVFPLPSIVKNLIDGGKSVGSFFVNLFKGDVSKATDNYLEIFQHANAIMGLIYIPVALGLTIAGAILGTPVGGAAVAGAMYTIGMALLAAFVATELAIVGKAIVDLSSNPDLPTADDACKRIASSSVSLGIAAALVLLSAIASKIGGALGEAIANLLRRSATGTALLEFLAKLPGQARRALGIKEPPGRKPGELGGGLLAEGEAGVKSRGPSKDGQRTLQINEKNVAEVCGCPDIPSKYSQQLNPPEGQAKTAEVKQAEQQIAEAEKKTDPDSKREALTEPEQKLADAKKNAQASETPAVKAKALGEAKAKAKGAIEELRKAFKEKGIKNDSPIRELDEEWGRINKDIADSKLEEVRPDDELHKGLQDDYRDQLNDVKNRADALKEQTLNPPGAFDVAAFEKSLVNLNANERVARVGEVAEQRAAAKGFTKDRRLTTLNNRDVYVDGNGTLYSVDTQHGRFEKCLPNGEHQGEVNFNLEGIPNSKDTSGNHDLKVR